jgi:hypothetical protein
MNASRVSLLILFLFSIVQSQAQDNAGKWRAVELNFASGGNSYSEFNFSGTEVNAMAPGSVILMRDYDGYYAYNDFYGYGNGSFNALVGFQKVNEDSQKSSSSAVIRLGLHYGSLDVQVYNLNREDRVRVDTLTSSQTGQMTFVDSVTYNTLRANYLSEQLQLDASVIFSSDRERRFSLYAGFGTTFGMTFNNRTDVVYTENPYFYYLEQNLGAFSWETEQFKNKNGLIGSAYVPIGGAFKLSNSHPLWSKLMLYTEFRPSISYMQIPESGWTTNANLASLFGVRYSLIQN